MGQEAATVGAAVTDRTDAVLEDIDGALTAYGAVDWDWAVGRDAMRWMPEKPEADPGFAAIGLTVSIDVSEFLAGLEAVGRLMTDLIQGVARAAADCAEIVAPLYGYCWEDGKLHYHAANASRRKRRRCRVCSPRAFSSSPWPDGAYYRHRQIARRRRNRRRR